MSVTVSRVGRDGKCLAVLTMCGGHDDVSSAEGGIEMSRSSDRRRGLCGQFLAVLLAVVLITAACGDDDDSVDPPVDGAPAEANGTASGDDGSETEDTSDADEITDDGDGGDAEPEENAEPIRVGSLLDETGPLNIYGGPMANATRLAIANINANGGVLGRPLELVALDSKSDQNEYITGADRLVSEDLAVVHAGITSASREAIRPTFREADLLYFYNVLYEGGQCDRNLFVTGVTPTQQLQVLIPWAIQNLGPKLYILAADYNYGQISADWVRQYAAENGGEIVGEDFFPLDVAEFGTTVGDVQGAAPDAVVSLLVGGAHISFYNQYAAAGANDTIPIVSSTFGAGGEHLALDADASANVYVAYPYFNELDNEANTALIASWQAEFGDAPITDIGVYAWEGWHLWAEAVNRAGTLDRDAVIAELESGNVSFEGPKGLVTIDGASHHTIQPMSLAQTNDANGFDVFETFDSVAPTWEQETCDLITNPDTNEQFTPADN